jgi:2-keto-4-pentenoate hydratase
VAIELWPDEIAGWKVGRIAPPLSLRHGAERLAGPIFARNTWAADAAAPTTTPVIPGGFAAVEAEYVFRLAADAAPQTSWSLENVRELPGELHVGVEIAGSPLATINELGPTVVVSDFGNNAGLIVGPPIEGWRERLDTLACETSIEGRSVGRGGASSIPGGPLEAVRFLLELAARRGRPLRAGQLISTGAATGIHDIQVGERSRVDFGPDGAIECIAVRAQPGAR